MNISLPQTIGGCSVDCSVTEGKIEHLIVDLALSGFPCIKDLFPGNIGDYDSISRSQVCKVSPGLNPVDSLPAAGNLFSMSGMFLFCFRSQGQGSGCYMLL
jgi:hypothetical protein